MHVLRYYCDTDNFGGKITGTRKRRKKRNKTGKRELLKSPAL